MRPTRGWNRPSLRLGGKAHSVFDGACCILNLRVHSRLGGSTAGPLGASRAVCKYRDELLSGIMGKRIKKSNDNKGEAIIGFGWYREDQWNLYYLSAEDKNTIHNSYKEWENEASRAFSDFQEQGVNIRKIDIDMIDLLRWCKEKGLKNTGGTRAKYISEQVKNSIYLRKTINIQDISK